MAPWYMLKYDKSGNARNEKNVAFEELIQTDSFEHALLKVDASRKKSDLQMIVLAEVSLATVERAARASNHRALPKAKSVPRNRKPSKKLNR